VKAFIHITMRKVSMCFLFLLLNWVSAHAQTVPRDQKPIVNDQVFRSMSLQREMHYRVIVPADYKNGGRFPVLYLLHGVFGDYENWDTRTHLENYVKNLRMIIIMPDADDSWYANSATVPMDRFEDYIAKDLISEVDEKFRTIRDRHARAIAGLSMGGYGAIKFGLQYPELFAFSGSLSGAFNATQNLDTLRPEFRTKLLEVFSSEGSRTRAENDVFTLLNAPHGTPYPYFYLACGTADPFLDTNHAFAQQLSSRNVPYEYHETAGGHTWEYWDAAVQPLLQAVHRALGGIGNSRGDVVKKRAH
jgi:S-formylglutathione hydrolase FrmB